MSQACKVAPKTRHILVTGGAGFIGSHVVQYLLKKYPHYHIYNLDALTYAGHLTNLTEVASHKNYHFVQGDITHAALVQDLFRSCRIDDVIHLAAETHVDRSIQKVQPFVRTNVMGTVCLLEAARKHWKEHLHAHRFYHASTDEVYGSVSTGLCDEGAPYSPQSPYAASKASADHFVCAYGNTHRIPFVIGCAANNYGPRQFPEKLMPLAITRLMQGATVPVYGKGLNVRNWLYVEDHVAAIDCLFHRGAVGARYNIGGAQSLRNIEVVRHIADHMEKTNPAMQNLSQHIRHVADRKGHDYRYAISSKKIQEELHWKPLVGFREGISRTVNWYLQAEKRTTPPTYVRRATP